MLKLSPDEVRTIDRRDAAELELQLKMRGLTWETYLDQQLAGPGQLTETLEMLTSMNKAALGIGTGRGKRRRGA